MSETILIPAQYGVVNTRPPHLLQPGELVSSSGVTVRRGDPYNVYPAPTYQLLQDMGLSLGSPTSVLSNEYEARPLTFDGRYVFYALAGPRSLRINATSISTPDRPAGEGRGSLTKFQEIYFYNNGTWDTEQIAEGVSDPRLIAWYARRYDIRTLYPYFYSHRLVEHQPGVGVVTIPVCPTDGHAVDVFAVDSGTSSGSSSRIGSRSRDRSHPAVASVPKFYVDPAVSSPTTGSSSGSRFQWTVVDTNIGSAGQFTGDDVYVYWYRYYCSEYDILAPTRYQGEQNCIIVQIAPGITCTHIDLFVDGLNADDDLDQPTDSEGVYRFDKIRIFRHRCRDIDEAAQIVTGGLPLTGGLVGELEFNTPNGFSAGTYYRDEDVQLYDGTIGYPLVRIDTPNQLLLYDRVRPKEPYTQGFVFQGSLVTDAPRLAEDVLVYTPPNEPWYNPAPYFIQISTTEDAPYLGGTVVNNVAVVFYRDRIARINYLPFTGETGQPVWEYITTTRGAAGRGAWCRFDNEQGSFIAFTDGTGLYATDGRAWFNLCENFEPQNPGLDYYTLFDDPKRQCLILHEVDFTSGTGVREWEFHYSRTHMTDAGLKVFGPTDLTGEGFEESLYGTSFIDPNPFESTPEGWLDRLVVFRESTSGRLEAVTRAGGAREREMVFGDFHPTNPKHALRVQRLGMYHGAGGKADSVSWVWSKHEVGQDPFAYPPHTLTLQSRGFSDLAQSITSNRYLRLTVSTVSPLSLGPIQVTTQGGEGGKNDS